MGFNSTIKKKHCKCKPDCDKYPTFSCFGYFYAHLPEDLAERAGTRYKIAKRNKNIRTAIAAKARKEQKLINGESDQELWYLLQMNSNEKICQNCGLSLHHYNEWAWRSSQNHIVDKSKLNGCPSVSTHPLNCNVLGIYCCHGQWSTNFENQSKMACFPAAKEKFQLFKDHVAPNEVRKVNPYLFQV